MKPDSEMYNQPTEKLQSLSEEFDQLTSIRHQEGAEEYGATAFLKNDMIRYIAEELADMANYARYLYIKLRIWEEYTSAGSDNLADKVTAVQREDGVSLGPAAFTSIKDVH